MKDAPLEMTKEELLMQIKKYKHYFNGHGGVTFSGGEPLLQSEFLLDMLKACKEEGIHTALDTSGVGGKNLEQIISLADLIILDVKALDDHKYEKMTGYPIHTFQYFVSLCDKIKTPLWIRRVIVPTLNDTKEEMMEFKKWLKERKNVEKVELLPYHTIGVAKYKNLDLPYPLEGIPACTKEHCDALQAIIDSK